ncbi:MAG: zinc-dependent alcohol dehydrogenase family protein [Xanthobacteraceae bacterium]|nr:zinc-dependent alcohol dehydrogenase family protein [Xanthobacteraceae bacterium]
MSNSSTMRALVVESHGGPFRLAQIPLPQPGHGQVLVRIKASGVNPLDTKIRAGNAEHARHPLPAILGMDLAGTVEAVGAGVLTFKRGDEVYGMTGGIGGVQGSLAEYAAVDADLLALKPHNLSMREAAALPLAFITAWEGLVDRANVRAGQKVLVHGGAGGVGSIAVQIAHGLGADVFATESAEKTALVEQLGAKALDYRKVPVEQYVKDHTDGRGFDVVYDTAGGAVLDGSFEAVARHGHVVSSLGWGTHKLAPLSFRGASYSGVFTLLPILTGIGRQHHGAIMTEATRLVEAGKVRPVMDPRRFVLSTASDAHAAVESGSAIGKIVVEID